MFPAAQDAVVFEDLSEVLKVGLLPGVVRFHEHCIVVRPRRDYYTPSQPIGNRSTAITHIS